MILDPRLLALFVKCQMQRTIEPVGTTLEIESSGPISSIARRRRPRPVNLTKLVVYVAPSLRRAMPSHSPARGQALLQCEPVSLRRVGIACRRPVRGIQLGRAAVKVDVFGLTGQQVVCGSGLQRRRRLAVKSDIVGLTGQPAVRGSSFQRHRVEVNPDLVVLTTRPAVCGSGLQRHWGAARPGNVGLTGQSAA